MFSKLGLPYIKEKKKLLVIGIIDNNNGDSIIKSFEKQKIEDKTLILYGKSKIKAKYKCYDNIKDVYDIISDYDFISVMNGNDIYEENYLLDLILADKYLNNYSFIGKGSYYVYEDNKKVLKNKGNEYQYVDNLDLGVGIIKREVIKSSNDLDKYLNGKLKMKKGMCFSIDRYSYVKYK